MPHPPQQREKPAPLTSGSAKTDDLRPGATLPARAVAAACSVLFIALALLHWHDVSGGRFTIAALYDPIILLCLAGSALCLLTARGRIGRHRRGWW